jgi:signal recognition particle GTPase
MTVTVDEIGKYLGKSIEDAMGRPAGKLVGLSADIKDEVTAVQVAQSNGEVDQYPINFVRIADGRVILLQNWRVEADDLKREHEIIRRRNQALDLLLKDGDIDQAEYHQQRSNYEELSKEINKKREALLDTLKEVETKVEQQIRDLQAALTNNKMLYTASEIDDQTYHTVTESIRAGLEIARKERKDLDNTREYLQAIDSIEPPKPIPSPSIPTKPVIPDVVVIKMKEPLDS